MRQLGDHRIGHAHAAVADVVTQPGGGIGPVQSQLTGPTSEGLQRVRIRRQAEGIRSIRPTWVRRFDQLGQVIGPRRCRSHRRTHPDRMPSDPLTLVEHVQAVLRHRDDQLVRGAGERHVRLRHPSGGAVGAHRQIHLQPAPLHVHHEECQWPADRGRVTQGMSHSTTGVGPDHHSGHPGGRDHTRARRRRQGRGRSRAGLLDADGDGIPVRPGRSPTAAGRTTAGHEQGQ